MNKKGGAKGRRKTAKKVVIGESMPAGDEVQDQSTELNESGLDFS